MSAFIFLGLVCSGVYDIDRICTGHVEKAPSYHACRHVAATLREAMAPTGTHRLVWFECQRDRHASVR